MDVVKPTQDQSEASGGAERRRWTRAEAEWPITIQLADGPHEARVRDISRAGVCFFLDRAVKEMTTLRIDLDLPVPDGIRRITGKGVVVRCEKIAAVIDHYEIAVFLQDVASPDGDTIEEYVKAWEKARDEEPA
jgi:hypothetical protein